MPEIWLRYGTTDVVLDIKFENLANHISSTFQVPQEQDIKTALASGVPLTDKMLFLGLSGSKAAAKIIMMLAEEAQLYNRCSTQDRKHAALQLEWHRDDLNQSHRLPVTQ
jgi:hypothetical protein